MSDEERYDLRTDIFFNLNQEQVLKFGDCYTALNQVIFDDRYKELFDKANNRWDAYDNNDLYGIVNTIRYISNSVKNQAFKNDLNRIEEDYSIYYGASEVLEGDRYKTIGIYRYK